MSDYGPQHEQVVALIERVQTLTAEEVTALGVAWDDPWGAARGAAWGAAWTDAWYAVGDAASALVVRDLIGQRGFTQERYDLLTGPWRTTIGPIHPDDKDLS